VGGVGFDGSGYVATTNERYGRAGPGLAPGAEPGAGAVPGVGPGETPGAGPGEGPGAGSAPGAGLGLGLGAGPGPAPGVGEGPALGAELAPRVGPVQGPGTTGMAQHIGGRRVSEFKGISGSATRVEDGMGAEAPSASPAASSSSSWRVEWGAAYRRQGLIRVHFSAQRKHPLRYTLGGFSDSDQKRLSDQKKASVTKNG